MAFLSWLAVQDLASIFQIQTILWSETSQRTVIDVRMDRVDMEQQLDGNVKWPRSPRNVVRSIIQPCSEDKSHGETKDHHFLSALKLSSASSTV